MSQGSPNPGFRSVKLQTEDFLKKDSQQFENSLQFGFLWIASKPGKQNFIVPFLSIIIIVKNEDKQFQIFKTLNYF